MKPSARQGNSEQQSIRVEELRAGDMVDLESEHALVIMVEKADQRHVLVAYEGREQIDYPIGTTLSIKARS